MAVVHGDIREPNVLWNSETGRVMVIDFERAVLLNLPRTPLSSLQPNRKRKRSLRKETKLSLNVDSHFGTIHAETVAARSVLG
jgi:thiamine kinase-like enzyme